jgi:hypothetical protein
LNRKPEKCGKPALRLKLGAEVTAEGIEKEAPDALIVAIGAKPIIPI